MKKQLEDYFNVLNQQHKDISRHIRALKKQYGYHEYFKHLDRTEIEKLHNIKEQKLHIKRIIKLMEV